VELDKLASRSSVWGTNRRDLRTLSRLGTVTT